MTIYRLHAMPALTGALTKAQPQALLAGACPLHKLMTGLTTDIRTALAAP